MRITDGQWHNHHALLTHQLSITFTIKTLSICLKEEVGEGLRRPFTSKESLWPAAPQKTKVQKHIICLGGFISQNKGLTGDRKANSRAMRKKILQQHQRAYKIVKSFIYRSSEVSWVTALRASGSPYRNTGPGTVKVGKWKKATNSPYRLQDQFNTTIHSSFWAKSRQTAQHCSRLIRSSGGAARKARGTEMARSICWLIIPTPMSAMVPNAARATSMVPHHLTVLPRIRAHWTLLVLLHPSRERRL